MMGTLPTGYTKPSKKWTRRSEIMEEPVFKSAESALRFLFNYAETQSPRGAWRDLAKNYDDYYYLGTGRGLVGEDKAAQAGMIAAKLKRLPEDQIWMIVALYYTEQHKCKTCRQDAPAEDWENSIQYLGQCTELEGVHNDVRAMIVKHVLGLGPSLDMEKLARRYSQSERTLFRQQALVKTKLTKLKKLAKFNIDTALREDPLLVA